MAVEAAMRQVGRFHDVGDADAVKSLLAEQRAGRIDDAFAILGGLLAAHSHCALLPCVRSSRLTTYMTIDINKQVMMMTII